MIPRYCLTPDRACIEVRGEDAQTFLQAQLSRAIDPLEPFAPLAGWHDARGRVRSVFRVVRKHDRWLLIAPSEGLDATVARLKMFVLRAAVIIERSSEIHTAMLINADPRLLAILGLPISAPPNAVVEHDAMSWVRLAEDTWQAVGPRSTVDDFDVRVARGRAALADLAEVRLGIPAIGPSLAERFVAQMLNLDELDALSFDKGCYPGQEIIARVRHLGSVKRRMRRYSAETTELPPPGTAVTGEAGAAVGEVVRAAPSEAGIELLAVIDHEAAPGPLHVDGTALREEPLPYPVPSG
jgi:folate-binding protein YgfZ